MRSPAKTLSHSWRGARLSPWAGASNPLPADMELGTTTVLFDGVNAGSEIRVYGASGLELAGVETCLVNPTLSWFVFGPAYNLNRIVVIHPDYKIKEFSYTPSVGNQSIPVQQERDKWYSNPV